MSLQKQIVGDIKEAMKSGESDRVGVLRMLNSAIKDAEISKRGNDGDDGLSEDEVMSVLQKEAKKRRDAIEAFNEGGRKELAEKEQRELSIVEKYLPEQLSEEDIRSLVKDTIKEVGAVSESDFGSVMGPVMRKVQGRADGKIVSRIAREELSK